DGGAVARALGAGGEVLLEQHRGPAVESVADELEAEVRDAHGEDGALDVAGPAEGVQRALAGADGAGGALRVLDRELLVDDGLEAVVLGPLADDDEEDEPDHREDEGVAEEGAVEALPAVHVGRERLGEDAAEHVAGGPE